MATKVARQCNLDFLFADRTFWSVGAYAYLVLGWAARWIAKASSNDQIDVADEYLDARCYKVVSCDFQDDMIWDSASLKTGIACNLLSNSSGQIKAPLYLKSNNRNVEFLFDLREIAKITQSIKRLQILEESLESLSLTVSTIADSENSLMDDHSGYMEGL